MSNAPNIASDSRTRQISHGAALSPFDENAALRQQASGLGRWVFDHRQQFSQQNPLAWYGARNVLNNIVSIFGLMATIVPVRAGMGKVARWADGRGYQKTQQFFSNAVLQNMLGVGVSFATFRTLYKMGQRAYDRVFIAPEDSAQTSQAIRDLPKNWLADFTQVAPAEYPATMIAAVPLVGIRAAITPVGQELKQHMLKDNVACALLAYPAFFEVTEYLGRSFQLARGYNTKETNEHLNKDKQSLGEFLTRQVPGVAAGIVPYIAANSTWYRQSGRQLSYNHIQLGRGVKEVDSFGKAFWKERPYQVFWMFSLGRDLYFDLYDKVTGRSKQAEAKGVESHVRRSHSASTVDFTRSPVADKPDSTVGHIQREGLAAPQERLHGIA